MFKSVMLALPGLLISAAGTRPRNRSEYTSVVRFVPYCTTELELKFSRHTSINVAAVLLTDIDIVSADVITRAAAVNGWTKPDKTSPQTTKDAEQQSPGEGNEFRFHRSFLLEN